MAIDYEWGFLQSGDANRKCCGAVAAANLSINIAQQAKAANNLRQASQVLQRGLSSLEAQRNAAQGNPSKVNKLDKQIKAQERLIVNQEKEARAINMKAHSIFMAVRGLDEAGAGVASSYMGEIKNDLEAVTGEDFGDSTDLSKTTDVHANEKAGAKNEQANKADKINNDSKAEKSSKAA